MFQIISERSKKAVVLAGMAMTAVYFVPLWFLILIAPQYRDGLGIRIWLTRISGKSEFDLKHINILNHYVGTRQIQTSDFPEFTYMPYILAAMILGAVITYFWPRMIMIYLGIASFFVAAISGLYDFSRWEHEYGRNLDPQAPLSIPGISFNPPLLGCKAMMNFNTCSWPHAGTVLLALSGIILVSVAIYEHKNRSTQKKLNL